jgi:hypothetical protein
LPEARVSNVFTRRFNFHEWLFRTALKHITVLSEGSSIFSRFGTQGSVNFCSMAWAKRDEIAGFNGGLKLTADRRLAAPRAASFRSISGDRNRQ